ncbi:hypothetical protein WT02_14970 [Burkholderia stagnalis]|nr:hypothetical protein WT03_24745 [Burkholderia stagnalis]KVL97072.1 hypothetical protein WT02_14970 [Burkholderia stagnalis]KVM17660.1 hypothetical protein WT04_02630 [Burkholderia stagnalis]
MRLANDFVTDLGPLWATPPDGTTIIEIQSTFTAAKIQRALARLISHRKSQALRIIGQVDHGRASAELEQFCQDDLRMFIARRG